METIPKVSVLMPAYNAEKYIREAVESILKQTFSDFEFIIIDDCSTDDTWGIIQEYSKKDLRITVAKNERNLGISATRNKLISLSMAKYVAWQDADDISLPYRIESQYQFMEHNLQVGISGGSLEFFNEKGLLSVRKYATDDELLRKSLFKYSPVAQPAAMVRTSVLREVGGFDSTLPQAEDLDLSLRIGTVSKFGNLGKVLIRYRLSSNSITMSKMRENIKSTLIVRKRAVKLYGYNMTLPDRIAYVVTGLFQYIPTRLIYFVFNTFRNS
ncbi:hypothetical protein A2333_02005 [Candidatus Wolfebacteria bacterium RIFOXYB2_FULL_49_7]|nr:MAG: hypothetical protein A2333_02005 [Candidatus Wolfebacteria bacterium RIFOXYB2_FULL_49_7]